MNIQYKPFANKAQQDTILKHYKIFEKSKPWRLITYWFSYYYFKCALLLSSAILLANYAKLVTVKFFRRTQNHLQNCLHVNFKFLSIDGASWKFWVDFLKGFFSFWIICWSVLLIFGQYKYLISLFWKSSVKLCEFFILW